jgi:hypothetical protein
MPHKTRATGTRFADLPRIGLSYSSPGRLPSQATHPRPYVRIEVPGRRNIPPAARQGRYLSVGPWSGPDSVRFLPAHLHEIISRKFWRSKHHAPPTSPQRDHEEVQPSGKIYLHAAYFFSVARHSSSNSLAVFLVKSFHKSSLYSPSRMDLFIFRTRSLSYFSLT